MEQMSFLPEVHYWIPEVDNNCRMWKCPLCGGRMVGEPMHWNPDFNPYHFCPYCGARLYAKGGANDAAYTNDIL